MQTLIINADDFGLSPGVNRGILSAFRDGILTSTTLLANLCHFDDAVALARENPELPVGVHLSLLWGPPVTDTTQIPSLLERDGRFPRSLTVLARRYFLGALSLEQVRIELRRQIAKVLDTGLAATHGGARKHIPCLPGIPAAVIAVAKEVGINKVRLPYEATPAPGPWPARAKQRLIRYLCRNGRGRLERFDMRTTDHFAGIGDMDGLDATSLIRILNGLDDGVTELMCHPGYLDDEARKYSKVPPHRETELEGLCDPRLQELVAVNEIRLTSYREL